MLRPIALVATSLAFVTSLLAQTPGDGLETMLSSFKSFQYETVIALAEELLQRPAELSDQQLIEVHRMKAIAHFTLGDSVKTRHSFEAILEIDAAYQLDPIQNSPKIVDFFQAIKAQYQPTTTAPISPVEKSLGDTLKQIQPMRLTAPNWTGAFSRSLLLPGWGHRIVGKPAKGWILSAAALTTAAGTAFFISDSHNKEVDYLNETDRSRIDEKYRRFNDSYRMRNAFASAFAVVWLYAQIDLLRAAHHASQGGLSTSLQPELGPTRETRLSLRISW